MGISGSKGGPIPSGRAARLKTTGDQIQRTTAQRQAEQPRGKPARFLKLVWGNLREFRARKGAPFPSILSKINLARVRLAGRANLECGYYLYTECIVEVWTMPALPVVAYLRVSTSGRDVQGRHRSSAREHRTFCCLGRLRGQGEYVEVETGKGARLRAPAPTRCSPQRGSKAQRGCSRCQARPAQPRRAFISGSMSHKVPFIVTELAQNRSVHFASVCGPR